MMAAKRRKPSNPRWLQPWNRAGARAISLEALLIAARRKLGFRVADNDG